MRRYIIVGSGVAAMAAAGAIRQQDESGEIVVVGEEAHPFYQRRKLISFLVGEIPEAHLFSAAENEVQPRQLHLRRISHRRVTSLAWREHEIELSTGERLSYDRLLLATGAQSARIDVPGARLSRVLKLDNLNDARTLIRAAKKAHVVVLEGGGISALQLAEGLRSLHLQVHYLLSEDRLLKNVLDRAESQIILQRLAAMGICIHPYSRLAEITGRGGHATGVLTTAGETIACDLVVSAGRVLPRAELARSAGLFTNRGILVDENLQTSAEDVFAAGDVTEIYDPAFGKSLLDTLWWAARAQGTTAGQNMAGQNTPYQKPLSFSHTVLAGLQATIIGATGRGTDANLRGITWGESETWRQLSNAFPVRDDQGDNHLRVTVGQKTLIGAVLLGDQSLAQPLYSLISEQAFLPTALRDRLIRGDISRVRSLLEFWSSWKQQHTVHPATTRMWVGSMIQ
ncbi:MAG: FAD-dependent oxidoreductase [Chloroflexi bacterium]|nr:FAD-dependent oxidoreductase [Chloroflexota bacterium]